VKDNDAQKLTSKKLYAGYFVCLTIAIIILAYFLNWAVKNVLSYYPHPNETWEEARAFQIWAISETIPILFWLEVMPVGVLILLWLEKGGGKSNLKGWNMGKWSHVISSLLFFGFLIIFLQVPINAIAWFAFKLDWYLLNGLSGWLFLDLILIGGIMILIGLTLVFYFAVRAIRKNNALKVWHSTG